MSALVDYRLSELATTQQRHRGAAARPYGRRGDRRRTPGPVAQPVRSARPEGVPAPSVAPGLAVRSTRRVAPAVALEPGFRLTDRGLALAMVAAVLLVVAAVYCITTTALRVTADPVATSHAVAARG